MLNKDNDNDIDIVIDIKYITLLNLNILIK